jgi:hypothetical protein
MHRMTYALLMAAVLCRPVIAAAQPAEGRSGWWFVPTVHTSAVHQDNVQVTDGSREVGAFLRVTSALETSYRVPRRTFQALYMVDSEKYTQPLRVLNDAIAQQTAGLRFEARPLGLVADARYMTTTRPEEVLEETGLIAAYRRTTAGSAGVALSRSLSARWRASSRYAFAVGDYGEATVSRPSARNAQHLFGALLSVQRSPRTTLGIEQSTRLLSGKDLTVRSVVQGTFWDGYLALRLTHSLTPRVRATVLAGPRLAQRLPEVIQPLGFTPLDWTLAPELLASVTFRDVGRSLDVSFARSAFLGFGAAGFIDTYRVDVKAGYVIARRMRLSARPAIYRNSISALHARSYRVDAAAIYDVTRWLAVEAAYLYKYQDRALSLADFGARSPARPKTRSTVMIGFALTRPIQMTRD